MCRQCATLTASCLPLVQYCHGMTHACTMQDNGTHFGRPGTGMGRQDMTCGSTVLMASCVPPAQSGAGDPEQWHRAVPPSGYGGAGAPGNQSVTYDALGNAHGGETLGATVLMGSANSACVGGRMGPPPLDQYGSRSGSSRPISGYAGGPRDMDLALGTPPRPVRVAEACTPRPYGPGTQSDLSGFSCASCSKVTRREILYG